MQTANIRARMTNPMMVLRNAMRALLALGKSAKKAGVPPWTVLLVHLRASPVLWAESRRSGGVDSADAR
jgi:hypothetical protein